MSMISCAGCSRQIHVTAPLCPGCGMPQNQSTQTAQSASIGVSPGRSDTWVRRFALMEKAGGPKLPLLKNLPIGERFYLLFNIWALLFGPFYYAAKGMWKKALTLSAVCFVVVVILAMILNAIGWPVDAASFVAAGVFSRRSNIDYYKKIVLGNNGWW